MARPKKAANTAPAIPRRISLRNQSAKAPPLPEEEEESSDEFPHNILTQPTSNADDGGEDGDEEEGEEEGEGEEEEEITERAVSDTEDTEEEDEREESVEVEPVAVPTKRKQTSKDNKKKKVQKIARDDDNAEDEAIVKIAFTITTFSAEELKKPQARRVAKSSLVDIPIDMAWIDAMGHFKIAISDLLFPQDAIVADDSFEMFWGIPRLAPGPFTLKTEANYLQIVNKVSKKSPAARIIVNEIRKPVPVEKENEIEILAGDPNPGGSRTKAKSKTKIRKETDILPGNIAINDTIKSIRQQWQCSTTTCKSDHCYVPADGPHFALGHEHCEKWAAAILRGPTHATLDKPPNIQLFDAVSTHTITSKSPLLQARLNAKAKKDGPEPPAPQILQAAPAPVHIYNYQQPPPATQVAAMTNGAPAQHLTCLIPAGHDDGVKLDLPTFCQIYGISPEILERLRENRITGTHAFGHLTGDDLKEMGFKLGEVIDLKHAVKEWSQKV